MRFKHQRNHDLVSTSSATYTTSLKQNSKHIY